MKKRTKICISVAFSGFAIGTIFYNTDFSTLSEIFKDLDYIYLIPIIISVCLGQWLMGYRYYFLIDKTIPIKQTICISILGNSANLVLPLRGGEVIKTYLSRQHSGLGYFDIASRIFLERSMDLGFAFCAGAIAVWHLGEKLHEKTLGNNAVWLILLPILILSLGLILIKTRVHFFIRFLERVLSPFTKATPFIEHLSKDLYALQNFISWRKICQLTLLSALLWFLLHSLSYWGAAATLTIIKIDYPSILFMLFAGALGLLIPSLPSGAGVIHASLSSALLLLGYSLEQSLAYALVLHTSIFVSLGLLGCITWFYFNFKIKTS